MHLTSLKSPVPREAPGGSGPSSTPNQSSSSSSPLFAACMDQALAQPHPQPNQGGTARQPACEPQALTVPVNQDLTKGAGKPGRGGADCAPPAATLGEAASVVALPVAQGEPLSTVPAEAAAEGQTEPGAANFAQQAPASSPPPLLLEAMALQLLAPVPNPEPLPPGAPTPSPQGENVPETTGLMGDTLMAKAPGVPSGLPVPGAPAAVTEGQSPLPALQMLQPIANGGLEPTDSGPGGSPAAIPQAGDILEKVSPPAPPARDGASLAATTLPEIPAGLKVQSPAAPAEPGALAAAVGTPAAQQQVSMSKAEKMLKSAAPAQQNLPGQADLPQTGQELTGMASSAERLASLVFSSATPAEPAVTAAASASASTPLFTPDARLHSLERTQDLVALHAVRLRESGADSLRVILEPGAGLNLSLELRWREGNIEAQATLHRGDFAFLNQHWAELQQRLEPRGVHLASLETTSYAGGGSEQFSQPQRHFTHEDSGASAFADFAFSDSMTDSPAARRSRIQPASRGWETWA